MPGFASTAAEGLFPPHVRTPEAALDYLSTWCDIIGGELLDGIEWDEIADTTGGLAVLRIPPFRIGFRFGTVLTIAINMDADLAAHFYKFDLRLTSGALCWRHDCRAGHESLGAGPCHRHLGPDENYRIADEPQTLETIFEHVTAEGGCGVPGALPIFLHQQQDSLVSEPRLRRRRFARNGQRPACLRHRGTVQVAFLGGDRGSPRLHPAVTAVASIDRCADTESMPNAGRSARTVD